ncbi:MAG: Maf family protein [Pseudodesulfovibrio sp.]|uniref:dTTP/UTP pyrophosphatase n=1 Tax=Pseudodesulfovibrio aespoeensis (strain ATCC 700646 / DSM 10631 / Aspo-2) TaxID=643562 RepID=E6VVZ4_PSEA9|nr:MULTISPECIES: Maf family protein [Pseudodesulfovibrio]MBU4192214.1 septum formation inhibitor Maf [Pseudomonadota bacterium]ADU62439.1 maf protein [Pseudodesulfovibrio aespoeensis Aspo-2]MBU4380331.1 septum formation inhibitor Maf [Pseudomonadota bacterium]MBU4473896.1 septum formation inhibitor Maf [Pseudomonadota bacterium]MBU4515094.1 septum formation inhibitor Maf [Pseudomonadota bacterium]
MTQKTPGPFTSLVPIVLASGSPRRRELLADLGLDFEVAPSRAEEPAPLPGELPTDYAARMAEMKTAEVAARFPDRIVLGADTIVVLGDRIMGKPSDAAQALAMLTALSGQTHQVITAFCLVLPGHDTVTRTATTDVDMRTSTETELRAYIATGEPTDKAGAYAIQGVGTFLVTAIRGSYTNVVGLPVARVLKTLLESGVVVPGGIAAS